MEQVKQRVLEFLLSQEGVKSKSDDFKNLVEYYGFSIDGQSAYSQDANALRLPDNLVKNAKKFGLWSVYLGNPEGVARDVLVRNLLRDSYFREYLDYPELLQKEYRARIISSMQEELKQTQDDIKVSYGLYTNSRDLKYY